MKALVFEKFIKMIKRENLLDRGDRIIVAVSGGADSVALLHLLVEIRRLYSLDLRVAHLNHGLRGSESDADERLVTQIAEDMDLACHVERIPAEALSGRKGNLENWARERRYDFLSRCATAQSAQKVGLGHTMTDQAETLLLRLIRGSGVSGLASMRPKRGRFVRPLLGLHREETQAYLSNRGLRWREDASNQDTRYSRNSIRLELLPFLRERYNPNITEVLAHVASVLRAESDAIKWITASSFQKKAQIGKSRVEWDVRCLLSYPPGLVSHLIRESIRYLNQASPSLNQVNAVIGLLQKGNRRKIYENQDLRASRKADRLVIESLQASRS